MSAEAGYTLADMLAALVVVGLAIGGLGQGVHVISRQQAATTAAIDRSADGAAVRDALARFLSSGPDAAALTGRPRQGPFRFAYQAGDRTHEAWPPDVRLPLNGLRGVAVLGAGAGEPLPAIYVRIREQQAFRCEYDTISGECRLGGR